MVTLGFIGLGHMGGPMATQLVRDGHDVVVFDRDSEAIEAIETAGGTGADSAAAVGTAAEIIYLSLPGPEEVKTVVSELEKSIEPGSVVVDMTTSRPETTETVAERLASHGATVLGSPVSGGTSGAADGTLTAMVSGDRATFEATREYFDAFTANVFYVGPDPGHGHAVKLLNNYLSNTALIATSEAVVLGQQIGIDIETMCEIFSVSSGRNSATEKKFPDAIAQGRDVGFALELMEKDTRLLLEFAEDKQVPLLVANVVRSQIGRTRTRYDDSGDMTDIYEYISEVATGAGTPPSDGG